MLSVLHTRSFAQPRQLGTKTNSVGPSLGEIPKHSKLTTFVHDPTIQPAHQVCDAAALLCTVGNGALETGNAGIGTKLMDGSPPIELKGKELVENDGIVILKHEASITIGGEQLQLYSISGRSMLDTQNK